MSREKSEDAPRDSSTDVSMEKVQSSDSDVSSSKPSSDVSLETVVLTSSEDESSLRWGPGTDLLATKPFEPFKMQFLPFHHSRPVNPVVPYSSDLEAHNDNVAVKKAVIEATTERDDVKSYVRVANETVAAEKTADEDLAHMVAKRTTAVGAIAKDEAPEEQEGDAEVVEHVGGA